MTTAVGEVLGGSVTPPDPSSYSTFPSNLAIHLLEGSGGNAVCAGRRGNGQTHSGSAENAAFGSAILVDQKIVPQTGSRTI